MKENEKKLGDWKMIIGGIVLIIALFTGVQFVFWFLGEAVPQTHLHDAPSISAGQSAPAGSQSETDTPSFCVHCGKTLPESFRWGQFCPWCGEKMEGAG